MTDTFEDSSSYQNIVSAARTYNTILADIIDKPCNVEIASRYSDKSHLHKQINIYNTLLNCKALRGKVPA